MLSPVIKRMLEERIGYEIRYPSDCERLMYEIAESTHQHIGVTTLKRLFGFIGGTRHPDNPRWTSWGTSSDTAATTT